MYVTPIHVLNFQIPGTQSISSEIILHEAGVGDFK